MVGCSVLLHACAFNIALLDRRLGNRWQGITLSPTLNTDILGQALAMHFAICLFASPLKSPPLSSQSHLQIRRYTWVKLTGQLRLINQTYASILQWVHLLLVVRVARWLWLVAFVLFVLGLGRRDRWPVSQSLMWALQELEDEGPDIHRLHLNN